MVTQRLYYKDPVKALYMAQEFGVKFCRYTNDKDNIIYDSSNNLNTIDLLLNYLTNEDVYISQESEHLFQVLKGDYFITNEPYDGQGNIIISDYPDYDRKVCQEIILREGKHFFMPLT